MIGEAYLGKCSVPCTVKRFMVNEIGLKEGGAGGIEIWFEKYVQTTYSAWTVDAVSLMSKIGGYIGISKDFMWLVIMFISSMGMLISKLKELIQSIQWKRT